jgi:uncharacterized RDD family membrane protein YckC
VAEVGWLYWTDAEHGPVTVEELAVLVRSGVVTVATDVREQTSVAWSNARAALPQLFDAPGRGPQLAPSVAKAGWSDRKPHPWRRYFARMVDSLVVGGLTWAALGVAAYSVAPDASHRFFAIFNLSVGRYLDAILTAVVVIPGNALMIGLTGVSVGKWVFGIRVLKDGRPLGVFGALRRELAVWWFGLGMGIPLITMLTLITSFNRLSHKGSTRWDKDQRITIVQRDDSILANLAMWVAGAVVLAINIALHLPPALRHIRG